MSIKLSDFGWFLLQPDGHRPRFTVHEFTAPAFHVDWFFHDNWFWFLYRILFPFQEILTPSGISPEGGGAGLLPGPGAGVLALLPGVQGEVEGAHRDGDGEGHALAEQRLAEVQALVGQGGVNTTHCSHFITLLLSQ